MKLLRYQLPTYAATTYPSLLNEMDRLFDAALERSTQFPVELFQATDAFTVRAELPGFRKEDLTLDLADGNLTITGQQKAVAEKAQPERRVSRTVSLPDNVDVTKITAAYENGLLTVTLPKREEARPRKIDIAG